MGEPRKRKRLFLKQPPMVRVVYSLLPILAAGISFFGWRVLALVAVCLAGGLATEWAMASRRGKPISQACLVTVLLYALSLPPTMPFGMALVGIVVAILFGKEVYGGFGRNWCNPAIVGRAFVYLAFPVAMTGSFVPAYRGFPGGLAHWSPQVAIGEGMDAVTAATPMWARRDFRFQTPLASLFVGNIGGTFEGPYGKKVLAAGSIGEVSALLILLGAIYLLATRTANWRLMLGPLLGATVACLALRHVARVEAVPPLLFTLGSGALLYGAVFMVTEPVSAPKKKPSIWIYGLLIGALIVFLRWKAQFAGAVAFAILIGNIVGPSLDMAAAAWADRRKTRNAGSAEPVA
jgi:Na+-transporting NADH:ubiquinone oxidoreductase subunit B